MTLAQRMALKRSEIVERLNELGAKNDPTAEERQEEEKLSTDLKDVEKRWRMAVENEDLTPETRETETETETETTSEQREWSDILGRVELRAYLDAVTHEKAPTGAELELQQALNLRANQVPWQAIAPLPGVEERDVTVGTDVEAQMNQRIIERVFFQSATAFLGVTMPMVGVGEIAYPIITGGATAEMKAKGAAVADSTMTLAADKISPTRLTVTYKWQREQAATVQGLEAALRSDLSMSMSDALDVQVLTGNGTAPNVNGFLAELADPTAATAEETFETYNSKIADFIDGKFAPQLGSLRQLAGVDTYKHMAVKFLGANPVNAESAQAYLMRITGGVRSSGNLPAQDAAKKQDAIVVRNARYSGHAYAPMWQGVTFIRDEITGAKSGEITLTAVALWGFKIVREDAYARVNYQVAA